MISDCDNILDAKQRLFVTFQEENLWDHVGLKSGSDLKRQKSSWVQVRLVTLRLVCVSDRKIYSEQQSSMDEISMYISM